VYLRRRPGGRVIIGTPRVSRGVRRFVAIPTWTHNARPDRDGILANSTGKDAVCSFDLKGEVLKEYPVPRYDESTLLNKSLTKNVARQALGRGLVTTPDGLIIAGDIDGQIYMRDFKLVDQSDMIVSLIPELAGGVPGLSSGVERELHHAFEHTKEVFVVWKPKKSPSPFITETATKIFKTVPEALTYFEQNGYFGEKNLFGN